ncbi:LPP20 family lipoprotein [Oceanobacter mangrovi]|uniref:LPP20 family lipoprotein n=1 Tax=Oceanobacter mangrovi TaxID=2862510 RepID=UPI001C8DC396|nr:LPP20 family lipoprotein [Oceanobacter mangrovi]
MSVSSRIAISAALVLTITGCTDAMMRQAGMGRDKDSYFSPVEQQVDPIAPMVLRVVGYGAMSNNKNLTEPQRRLMAIRAARMDAYRVMAERVYGTSIQGSTTVRDMVVENDRLRTYVETYLHGARVVSTDVMPDGTVETLLEMTIDQGFRNCLQVVDNQRMNVDCRVPLGGASLSQFVERQNSRVKGEAAVPESGFYFIE